MINTPTKLVDALIVGAGPAGLSAALGLSRVHRTKIVFTKPQGAGFRNEGIHEMHNVLSRDCIHPAEFRNISREQIEKYGTTEFVEADITSVKKIESGKDGINGGMPSNYFEVVDSENRKWQGRKVLLAMGSVEVFLTNIPGYRENWPSNIYQCLFCDGHEHSHLPGGIIGFSPMHAHMAQMLNFLVTETSGPPMVFSNGPIPDAEEFQKALAMVKALGFKIETEKIKELIPKQEPEIGVTVLLENGRKFDMGYLNDKPMTILGGRKIIEELGVEIDSHPFMGESVKSLDMFGGTKISGVFVAGDASTPMKAATVAISSGAGAAAGIARDLAAEEVQRLMASSTK